jgi:hypothetical protein
MKKGIKFFLPVLFILTYMACRKPYKYPAVTNSPSYLVVEGNISSGDTTIIKLSRTINIGAADKVKPELKAIVSIQSDQNNKYVLTEAGNGNYKMSPIALDVNKKYSLLITTSDGKTYQSDYVPMKLSPPIDSVYYKIQNDTVLQFFVNTHDPNNNTHYYRWDYQETWAYTSDFQAFYQWKNNAVVPLDPDSLYYDCYRSDFSTQVFVAATNQQSQDLVNAMPIGAVFGASQKISHIYSMLLSQYAITPEGLTYWSVLKKNTEELGSIFDADPSTIQGNIHCTSNPSEPVIGFMNASSVSKKRIVVDYKDLVYIRADLYYGPPSDYDCSAAVGELTFQPANSFVARGNAILARGDLLTVPHSIDLNDTSGYFYAPRACVDCRLKGGTNIRPSYFHPPPYR